MNESLGDPQSLERFTLQSREGLEYSVFVARPVGRPPPGGYPVIYVLDGNYWTAIVAELIRMGQMHPGRGAVGSTVVIGIGYNAEEACAAERRLYDLSTPCSDCAVTRALGFSHLKLGGADRYFEFIENSVKPRIEARFTINRNRQVLCGHSCGGLFTLRTLLLHPHSYRSYIAISPALFWNDREIFNDEMLWTMGRDALDNGTRCSGQWDEMLWTMAPANRFDGLRAFISVGDLEQNPQQVDIDILREISARLPRANHKDVEESSATSWRPSRKPGGSITPANSASV